MPHLRLQAALRRALGRGRPPLPRRRDQPRPDREARAAWGQRRSRRSAAARHDRAAARRHGRGDLRAAPRPGRAAARGAAQPRGQLEAPPAAAGVRIRARSPTRRPATSSSTSRATRSGTPRAASSTSGASATATTRSRRSGRRAARRSRQAFETFIDLVHARLAEHPDMHVYHYAQYEITALRRMMGRYGTREAELDDLLRREVFVDLYRVVRGGLHDLAAGVRAEGDRAPARLRARRADQGRRHLDRRVRALDDRARPARSSAEIEAYNREDCIGTRVLADWLLERRGEALAKFGPFPLPEPQESKPVKPEKAERAALREAAARDRRRGGRARGRAPRLPRPRAQARLVGDVRQGGHDARGAARGQGGDRRASSPPASRGRRRSRPCIAFTYPRAGAEARQETRSTRRRSATPASSFSHDPDARELELKRGPKLARRAAAGGAAPGRPVQHEGAGGRARADRRARCSRATAATRRSSRCCAASRSTATCRRTRWSELTELLLSLDGRHLVIQGPPGSGKT